MEDTAAQRVAANVRAAMARERITQTALSAHLEISQAAVSRRLRGTHPFDVTELAATADLLGVPVAAFFDDAPLARTA